MRVLVALSGGVDSSVAAALLVEDGHEVVGATMKLWGGASDTGCCSVGDVEDARRCAAQLGIDHHVFNYSAEFDQHVVEPYVADHAAGRTPNPCVECNRHLKFDVLLERAELLGFDAVATGHHARIVERVDGTRRIARGADEEKDQSYVLYTLRGRELDRVLFPIGELTKAEVRELAAARGLRTADKPESQDLCFITRAEGRAAFLAERIEMHPGRVVDQAGVPMGTVEAVELVTVGQRRGLHLAGGGARRFVTDVDVEGRTVTVGPPEALRSRGLELHRMVWADVAPRAGRPLAVDAQVSAHGLPEPASATVGLDGEVALRWLEPQRKVAPGQSVVLYEGDEVLGGGIVVDPRR